MVERQLLPSGTTVLQHGGICGHEHCHLPHQRRQLKTAFLGTTVLQHGGICGHEHCHLPHQRRQLKTAFLGTKVPPTMVAFVARSLSPATPKTTIKVFLLWKRCTRTWRFLWAPALALICHTKDNNKILNSKIAAKHVRSQSLPPYPPKTTINNFLCKDNSKSTWRHLGAPIFSPAHKTLGPC